MNICNSCGKATKNPKYCSRSCSGKVNNRKYPKRMKEGKCTVCKTPIHSNHTYCIKCKPKIIQDNETLREVIYTKHHKSSTFALVRNRARTIAKKLGYNKCCVCGYDKHIEIAHIIAISKFNLDSTVGEVNSKENLLPLCPNCHWEFDNNLIIIAQKEGFEPT